MLLRVGMLYDLPAVMNFEIFRNKATKNLSDYAVLVVKIPRFARNDSVGGMIVWGKMIAV